MDPEEASDQEILAHARALAQQVQLSLPARVDPATVSLTAKIPFKALYMRELLIHRVAELATVACDLFERGLAVSAFIVTRALLETVASMFCLNQRVSLVVQTGGVGDVDDFLMKGLSGWKEAGAKTQAVNVLTLVGRVSKDIPSFRQLYDALSEFAHPNWCGLEGAYGKIDFEKLWVDLGSRVNKVPVRIGLSALAGGLEMFAHFYDELGGQLPKFTRICEEALEQR